MSYNIKNDMSDFFKDNHSYTTHIRTYNCYDTDETIYNDNEIEKIISAQCNGINIIEESDDEQYKVNIKSDDGYVICNKYVTEKYTLIVLKKPELYIIYENHSIICIRQYNNMTNEIQQIILYTKNK